MSGMKMCFHDAKYYVLSIRFYKDPATIIPRSHSAYSATSLRLSRSFYALHVLTTTIPRVIRLQHDLTAIIARSYHDYTTFIPRSYYVLSNTVNIVFHINIVPFLLFLIKTEISRKQYSHATKIYQNTWAWWQELMQRQRKHSMNAILNSKQYTRN